MKKTMNTAAALLLALILLLTSACSKAGDPAKAAQTADRSAVYASFAQSALSLDDCIDGETLGAARFGGVVGTRMENQMNNWMYTAYYANPMMIQAIRQRNSALQPQLMAWYGEFVGKYMTSVSLMYSLNRDEALKTVGDEVVQTLSQVQGEDGYLGVFSEQNRMLGESSMDINGMTLQTYNWDMWNHYHIIRGLLGWYEQTGSQTARDTAVAAADYIIRYFSDGHTLAEVNEADKNLSILSVYVDLYKLTEDKKYLTFANDILAAWQGQNACDYISEGLEETPYSQLSLNRWETLHALLGIADVYELTGDEDFKTAFVNLFESLRTQERHNSGGMMNSEKAVGSPYASGAIETCASVAWTECCAAALRITGESTIADELELTTLNAILGAQSPSGRWYTYNTPDEGIRLCSATELNFQAESGSPELNCCAVSGPSGLAMLSEWALTAADGQLTLNYYGDSTLAASTASGNRVLLTQQTQYPKAGDISLTLELAQSEQFTLRLRIPAWSANTVVTVNGEAYSAQPGSYCEIDRSWNSGDTVELSLDMAVHYWVGDINRIDEVSIYYGPLLLAYDERFNETVRENELPDYDFSALTLHEVANENVPSSPEPIVLFRAEFADGSSVILTDFATAGAAGTYYNTWIPATDTSGFSAQSAGSEWLAVRTEG